MTTTELPAATSTTPAPVVTQPPVQPTQAPPRPTEPPVQPTQAPPPPPTEPPPVVPDPPQPPAHTFTHADMEELLAYGQSLGFEFAILATPSSGIVVAFAISEDTRMLELKLRHDSPTIISLGHRADRSTTLTTFFGTAISMDEAKNAILNHYNNQ